MIIECGGEKGGTGKTMLATNLAIMFTLKGRRAKLIDADPQGSSARFASKRAGLGLQPFIPWGQLQGPTFFALREEAKHYDVLIVDCGGADSVEFESTLSVADVLLSPIIPSDCDLATLAQIEKVVERVTSGGHLVRSLVVLNHVSTHVANDEAEEARAALSDFKQLKVAESTIHTRKVFRDAFKARLSVPELVQATDRRSPHLLKAVEEIAALYEELTVIH